MTDDEIEKLKQHIKGCPIGWHNEELKLHRATKAADVTAWILELERLVGIQHDLTATKTRLPRPYSWESP